MRTRENRMTDLFHDNVVECVITGGRISNTIIDYKGREGREDMRPTY